MKAIHTMGGKGLKKRRNREYWRGTGKIPRALPYEAFSLLKPLEMYIQIAMIGT